MLPTLLEIAANPASLDALPIETLAALRGEVMRLDALILARLMAGDGKTEPSPDRLLDAKEAAERLHVSPDWLYRRVDKLPFVLRMGGRTLFSERGIEAYIKRRVAR